MIKKKLKRMLEYCPKPPAPLTTTLKRYSIPITLIVSVSIALASFFLFYFAPAQSTIPPPLTMITGEYNPGVKVGDYMTYGNFVCNLEHEGESVVCINDLAFRKIEVIEISGKEVTLLYTEQYKNGSTTWKTGCTEKLNVEDAWWSDDTESWIDGSLLVAANLTECSCIHLGECDFPGHQVIGIEVRTYWGVSRDVILLRYPSRNVDGFNVNDNYVYDRESGIKLEHKLITSEGDVIQAISIVETNIFSTSSPIFSLQENTAASIPTEAFYAATGSVVFVVSVVAGVIFRKKGLGGGENDNE